MSKRMLLFAALMVGCGRPGDGQETSTSKNEWGILQVLEESNRGTRITNAEVTDKGDYRILSLMGRDQVTRVWIMLDPKSPPFYKQLPADQSYDITKTDLEMIRTAGEPISSTNQALESHLIK